MTRPVPSRKRVTRCILAALLAALPPSAALAQETRGSIAGRVVDASGAVIPGVQVTATNIDTELKLTVASNLQGNYLIPYLLAGNYRIGAHADGFKAFSREGIVLRMDDRLQLDIQLEIGSPTETVTVTARTPLMQASSASLGQVIDQRQLSDLPILHGNPMLLMQLSSEAVSVATNISFTDTRSGDNARLTEYAVAGTHASTHEITLDGATNSTTGGGAARRQRTIAYVPPSDIVSEFKIQTASYDASVGNSPGALISISLKSGTNAFHGGARYFKTNPGWNANDFFSNMFGRPRSFLKNNHAVFSGTGPVLLPGLYNGRNRTFFMYGYERQLDDAPFAGGLYSVPTLKQRDGDFSDLLKISPQYQIYDPAGATLSGGRISRRPFPNNIIPASRISPVASNILGFYPKPRSEGLVDGTQNFPYPDLLLHSVIWSHTGRIDHNISDRQRIFVRAYWGEKDQIYRDYWDNLASGMTGGFFNRGLALDDVYTFSPRAVLNVRYGLARHIYPNIPKSQGMDLSVLGWPPSLLRQLDLGGVTFPAISISGLSPGLGNEKPTFFTTTTHQVAGTFDWMRGNQMLKFGADFRVFQENYYNWRQAAPFFSFGSNYTRGPLDNSPTSPGGVGQGTAAFLLGLSHSGAVDRNASYAVASPMLGLFVHNDWRITPRLTLNLGLRYEVEGALTERFNRTARELDTTTVDAIHAQVRTNYARSPIAELSADSLAVRGGLRFAGVDAPRGLFTTPKKNLAPRFGFAYQLRRDTVARGGYGIFFGFVGQPRSREQLQQYGFSQRTNLVPTLDGGLTFAATLDNPFPDGVLEPPGASKGLRTEFGNTIAFINPNPKTPYNQRWSIGIQRVLPGSFVVEADYVGNRGVRLETDRDLRPFNPAFLSRSPVRDQAAINYWTALVPNPFYPLLPGTGLAATVLSRDSIVRMAAFPQFTGVTSTDNSGYTWYHGFNGQVERRFRGGYMFQIGYTWSKFMQAMARLNGQLSPLEECISPNDRPHRLTLNGIYELPFGPGKRFGASNALLGRIIGGWQLQWLYVAQSGPPLSFGNVLLFGNIQDITLPVKERGPNRWFRTEVFNRDVTRELSYNYRTVSSRFNDIRADGRNLWNMSLIKSTRIREPFSLQIRAEAFNVFNHAHFSAPNTTPTSAAFGRVEGTTTNPRLIQLGLKLEW